MKNQKLAILTITSICWLALFGCAPSDSGGGGGNQASLQPSNQEEEAFNIARYVPYTSSLPTCNAENLNQIYFIGSVNEFRYCSSQSTYISLDLGINNNSTKITSKIKCQLSILLQSNESIGTKGIQGYYIVTTFSSGDKEVSLELDDNNGGTVFSSQWAIANHPRNESEYISLVNDVVGTNNYGVFEAEKSSDTTFQIIYTDSSNSFYGYPDPQSFTYLYSDYCDFYYPSN